MVNRRRADSDSKRAGLLVSVNHLANADSSRSAYDTLDSREIARCAPNESSNYMTVPDFVSGGNLRRFH